jgi:hypothetical protein
MFNDSFSHVLRSIGVTIILGFRFFYLNIEVVDRSNRRLGFGGMTVYLKILPPSVSETSIVPSDLTARFSRNVPTGKLAIIFVETRSRTPSTW